MRMQCYKFSQKTKIKKVSSYSIIKIINFGKNIIPSIKFIFYSYKKKKSSVIEFVNSLELFGIGYSWGGFESLAILQDLKNTEYIKGRHFYRFGKDEHIVRLHID